MAQKRCIYCGVLGELTRDHVPPKNLFPEPRPDNLITVPCCSKCNSSFAADDEHFRTMIACAEQSAAHPQGQRLWPTILRQLRRKGDSAITELIRQSFGTTVDIPGAILRVDRVLRRVVKGLHYHETGASMPDHWEIRTNLSSDFGDCGGLAGAINAFRCAPGHTERMFGNGVFCYQVVDWPGRDLGNVWLLSFFECIGLLCASGPSFAPPGALRM